MCSQLNLYRIYLMIMEEENHSKIRLNSKMQTIKTNILLSTYPNKHVSNSFIKYTFQHTAL